VPFRDVFINAIVRDAEGQKMSKSKGNTIDPLDVIDGITLADLVAKSTQGLMLPAHRQAAEKRVKRDYPRASHPTGRTPCASPSPPCPRTGARSTST